MAKTESLNQGRKAHLEIYGYNDPYWDMSDGSLKSAKVKCYMDSKKLGLNLKQIFVNINNDLMKETEKYIGRSNE